MAAISDLVRLVIFCIVMLLLHSHDLYCTAAVRESDREVYIAYMGNVASAHHDMLESALKSREEAEKSLIYSYTKSFNGFAASLSPSEAARVQNMDGVVSVFPNRRWHLHTTRSWDFLGFSESVQRNLQLESDVIIGMFDTGIWPESESFDDAGFGPPPSKWKGTCDTSNFTCNNKIIGARAYRILDDDGGDEVPRPQPVISPRDTEGHGTHTASTAAGNVVKNASMLGIAEGDARGAVPGARISVYKICWIDGCTDADILAAFDDAIHDGVDIISASLGFQGQLDYLHDSIAIGSFHAMSNGILTSNSAGNDGPINGTVSNYSPWSLTVAASNIDRQFYAPLILANRQIFRGPAINTFTMKNFWYPMIIAADAPNTSAGFTPFQASFCPQGSLDVNEVKDKIVVCQEPLIGADQTIYSSGAVGVVIVDNPVTDYASDFFVPATVIQPNEQGDLILAYVNSTRSPRGIILKTRSTYNPRTPVMASFSSRGPNPITPNVLKPDVTGPGVDILASWSKAVPVTNHEGDHRFVDFKILSGTSMSCPHVTGAAAYVKSFHPEWSPAAIKSALMTTAHPLNTQYHGNEDAELAFGSGEIDPVRATNPGLVYDADVNSYVDFLCSHGYNATSLALLVGNTTVNCPKPPAEGVDAFNYPSIMIAVQKGNPVSGTFMRNVTNVGSAQSTYQAVVKVPSGIQISVEPNTLSFNSTNQILSFSVEVKGEALPSDIALLSGSLTWTFGNVTVRSPIVIYSANPIG